MRTTIPAQLFAAAQAGEPAALDELLKRLRPDIRRFVRFQCRRGTAVDDVVQEALIIVHRKMGTIKVLSALGGWLATTVIRLCLLPDMLLWRQMEDIAASSALWRRAEVWPDHDLRLDLVRALESLPTHYRTIVLMRDMQELTIREIATELGLTIDATKSRLHRARALIREYLSTE
jgi:RNA polymerase sigma-70 factor (ECF subfamily)